MLDGPTGRAPATVAPERTSSAIFFMADSVIGWFKQKLGIRSPSRVFAELGGFTMAGLAQGLDKGQAGPLGAVQSLAGKLTAIGAGMLIGGGALQAAHIPIDTRAPISASRQAVVSAPDNVVFNIHQAPGQSQQELVGLIEKMLNERDRKKAAAGRSRMTDVD